MKKQTLFFALLTIIVLETGIIQAEEKAEQELSNTRYAEVEFRVTTDPKTVQFGEGDAYLKELRKFMFTPHVVQVVSEEILDTSNWPELFSYKSLKEPSIIGGIQTARVKLAVSLTDQYKPAAKEFLEAYIEKLKSALLKEYDIARNLQGEKLSVYFRRKDRAEMELHNLLSEQSELAGGRGKLDKESVRQRILEHEKAINENNMQHSMLTKRAEELVKQISEANRRTDEIAVVRDAILGLMSDRDGLRTKYKEIDFKRNQYAENDPGGSHDKIVELTSKLSDLEANINHVEREIDKLSKHEQQLESQTAGDIQELNRQLRETTMQLEELEIKKKILYGYSPGDISDSIEYEMLEVKIEAAKENLRRAILDKDEAALQYDLLQPPTISYDEIVNSETIPDSD